MIIDAASDILGLVDIQPTFMPGGELAVADGEAVVPIVNRLLPRFVHAYATQDWHPPGHSSFASSHSGHKPYDTVDMPYGTQVLWPDHALQGTANAALHPALDLRRIFLAGIATDFCVAWSAEDALRLGYEVVVIEDACRGIGVPTTAGRTTLDDAREKLTAVGARFITSAEL